MSDERTPHEREGGRGTQQTWVVGTALLAVTVLAGCALGIRPAIPREFLRETEPGVTLTALKTPPNRYEGMVLILGGGPLAEIQEGGRLWLRLKNRPLDAKYQPHRSVSLGSPENGYYWAVFSPQDVPHTRVAWCA